MHSEARNVLTAERQQIAVSSTADDDLKELFK